MRTKRILVQGASWYEVRTAVNNREPLFQQQQAIRVFCRVLGEAQGRFTFELRGFRLEKEWLSFYIKPAEGLQLPAIMQWLKQTFAVRFNRYTKKTGHVWGDRYWSKVLSGEPPEEAGEVGWKAVEVAAETGEISFGPWLPDGVSPPNGGKPGRNRIFAPNPRPSPSPARLSPQTRPRSARNRRYSPLAQRRQTTATGEVCPKPHGTTEGIIVRGVSGHRALYHNR